jgi:ubiquinone/menaquinone biosynthesis C-methylase UbiE
MTTATPPVPNHHAHHRGFSGLAGLLAALTMVVGRRNSARLAAATTGVTAADHVLDIGCGPGAAAREASRRGASVTALDPASVMRTLGRALSFGHRSIRWIDGTAEALPLDDGAVTVCWSIATVHHWRDIGAGLAEAHRVLAPGGRFVAIERRSAEGATGLASHGWTDAQADTFADRLRSAGFVDVVSERVSAGRGRVQLVRATRS